MYFKVILYQNIFIPARFFGKELNSQILSNIISITEGKKTSPFGTVIIIISFFSTMSLGKILPGSSSALFRVSYEAVTFRAMKGEILDVIVTHLTKFGFFAEAGLLEVFVSKELIPNEISYIKIDNDLNNKISQTYLEKGKRVKIRIIGLRNSSVNTMTSQPGTIQAIGTMKGLENLNN